MRHLWKDKGITMPLPAEVGEADYLLSVMLFSNAPNLIEPYLFHISKARQINVKGDWGRDHYWTEVASEAPPFEDMKKMASRSYKRGLVAGWFLCVLYVMEIKGVKEPSKLKARDILSKNYLTKKWGDGSHIKCSRTLIETVEKEYQNVAHLWAALAINHKDLFPYSEVDDKALLGLDFEVFLKVSKMLENFGLLYLDTRNKQEKPVIPSVSPWLLSNDIVPNKLTLSQEIDWLQSYLN
jgi:hypothetical protein